MDNKDPEQLISETDERISLNELTLKAREWRRYIASKRKLIWISALAGALLGLACALIKKPTYEADLTFALQDEKSLGALSGVAGIASQFGLDLGGAAAGGEFSGDNLVELLKLRTMVENALLTSVKINGKEQTLADLYISFNNLRDSWEWTHDPNLKNMHYLPRSSRLTFTPKQDSMLNVFQEKIVKKNLSVDKTDKKLNIVYVTVISKNEIFSKFFADALERVVSDFYVQTKVEKESKNVASLQRQTDSVRRELNSAIQGVAVTTDVNPHANIARQTLHVPSLRKQVDVQANTIILGELVKNLEITKMSLLQETPILHVIDHPTLPLEKKEITIVVGVLVGGFLCAFLAIVALAWAKISLKFDLTPRSNSKSVPENN